MWSIQAYLSICFAVIYLHASVRSAAVENDPKQKKLDDPIESNPINELISFQCYNLGQALPLQYKTVKYAKAVHKLKNRCMVEKTTVFYFPGMTKRPSYHEPSVDVMAEEFLIRGGINFITVNYEVLVSMNGKYNFDSVPVIGGLLTMAEGYKEALANSTLVAEEVAKVFVEMIREQELNLKRVRFVGQSVGCQIISMISRIIKKELDVHLHRITALDPAGPGFYIMYPHLSAEDAKFVDVWHTNPGMDGYAFKSGTVDFYFNFPHILQPGCHDLTAIIAGNKNATFCSHERAWKYYSQSINHPQSFPAFNNGLEFLANAFAVDASTPYVGYDVNTSIRGKYMVKVSATSAFGFWP